MTFVSSCLPFQWSLRPGRERVCTSPFGGEKTMQGLPQEVPLCLYLLRASQGPDLSHILFIDPGSETLNKQPKATQRVRKTAEPGSVPRLSGPHCLLRTSWDWNRLLWRWPGPPLRNKPQEKSFPQVLQQGS